MCGVSISSGVIVSGAFSFLGEEYLCHTVSVVYFCFERKKGYEGYYVLLVSWLWLTDLF